VKVIECVKDLKGITNNSQSIIDRQSCLALFPCSTITGKVAGWRPMRENDLHCKCQRLSPLLSSLATISVAHCELSVGLWLPLSPVQHRLAVSPLKVTLGSLPFPSLPLTNVRCSLHTVRRGYVCDCTNLISHCSYKVKWPGWAHWRPCGGHRAQSQPTAAGPLVNAG
jgi:hypothetical protein